MKLPLQRMTVGGVAAGGGGGRQRQAVQGCREALALSQTSQGHMQAPLLAGCPQKSVTPLSSQLEVIHGESKSLAAHPCCRGRSVPISAEHGLRKFPMTSKQPVCGPQDSQRWHRAFGTGPGGAKIKQCVQAAEKSQGACWFAGAQGRVWGPSLL